MDRPSFEISWATLWRILLMLIFAIMLFMAREALIILFLAIIISASLDGPVWYLQRKKIPRILGTLLIFLSGLMILAVVLYIIIPVTFFELQNVLQNFKNIQIPSLGTLNISYFAELSKSLGDIENLINALMSGGVSFFNLLTVVFNNLVFLIATIVLSFYFTINQFGVEKFLKTILPINYEDYVIEIYLRVRKKMGYWLQGQIILMTIVGILTWLGLSLLNVKYSLVLGVVAGIFEIVPMVGPIFSGAIVFLAAISESWTLGLYVILLFVVIHQIENHILVPLVMKKTLGISPVVVVVYLLAGWQIAGVIGAILAVPVAVIFQEIIDDWERRKLKTGRLIGNE